MTETTQARWNIQTRDGYIEVEAEGYRLTRSGLIEFYSGDDVVAVVNQIDFTSAIKLPTRGES